MTKLGPLRIFGQPEPHDLKDLRLVGRYAMGADWADNHGSIYPFEQLRRACSCGACTELAALTDEMAWPSAIKRLPEGVRVEWSDAHVSLFPYRQLRALCRCAACTGGH
jgi:DUF971 family protein